MKKNEKALLEGLNSATLKVEPKSCGKQNCGNKRTARTNL